MSPGIDHIKMTADFDRNAALEVATTEECVSFLISGHDSTGELENFGPSRSVNLNAVYDTQSTLVHFFNTKEDCRNDSYIANFLPLPDGQSIIRVYVDPQQLTAGINIPVALTSSDTSVQGSSYIAVVNPASLDHYHVETHGSAQAGSCRRIKIGAYDSHKPNSYPVHFPAGESITVIDNSSGPGHFFSRNLDWGHPSGYPCDWEYVSAETLGMTSFHSSLNSSLSTRTSNIFYYQPLTYATSNAFSIQFNSGEEKSIGLNNVQASQGFLTISDGPSFDFPDQSGTITASHLFTITNEGSDGVALGDILVSPAAQFSVSSSCPGSLGVGASCTVTVIMLDDGQDNVTYSGVLRVEYTASGASRVSHVNLKGRRLP
jgi:hypothetical protein